MNIGDVVLVKRGGVLRRSEIPGGTTVYRWNVFTDNVTGVVVNFVNGMVALRICEGEWAASAEHLLVVGRIPDGVEVAPPSIL